MPPLDELAIHFQIGDLLDIAVVTVLLYATLSWMRWRTSHALLISFALMGLLYLLARLLDMYLTILLFQIGIGVIVFSLVVVFQQDLRRGFERLASWRIRWFRKKHQRSSEVFDVLVESVGLFAEKRIGALIVLQGREPLDAHLRGGIRLKGEVSIPLLHSLFHPETPGHDGAAVIYKDRLQIFGAHLPLSQNVEQIKGKGTRHTAALGLAERSDALVIVVSEERGKISIAEEGVLEELRGPAALKDRLAGFERHYQGIRSSRYRELVTTQLPTMLVSLGLACVLWYTLAYRVEQVQQPVDDVIVEYRNVPEGWIIDENAPAKIRLTLAGSERAFRILDRNALKVSLDLSRPSEKTFKIPVTDQLIKNLPQGLSVSRSETETIQFEMFRITSVPVVKNLSGAVPKGYSISKVEIQPDKVPLIVRPRHRPQVPSVPTAAVSVDAMTKTTSFQVPIELPTDLGYYARFVKGKAPVVRVTVHVEKLKEIN